MEDKDFDYGKIVLIGAAAFCAAGVGLMISLGKDVKTLDEIIKLDKRNLSLMERLRKESDPAINAELTSNYERLICLRKKMKWVNMEKLIQFDQNMIEIVKVL
jgi:hypothetical protein